MLAYIIAFILIILIVFISYNVIKFLGSVNVGRVLLFTYLVIKLSGTLIDLLLKVLK